jgi:hypothetical protein
MVDVTDDPFKADPKEVTVPKTIWLRESTFYKLEDLLARAEDPKKLLARVKEAIDIRVDELAAIAPARKES